MKTEVTLVLGPKPIVGEAQWELKTRLNLITPLTLTGPIKFTLRFSEEWFEPSISPNLEQARKGVISSLLLWHDSLEPNPLSTFTVETSENDTDLSTSWPELLRRGIATKVYASHSDCSPVTRLLDNMRVGLMQMHEAGVAYEEVTALLSGVHKIEMTPDRRNEIREHLTGIAERIQGYVPQKPRRKLSKS